MSRRSRPSWRLSILLFALVSAGLPIVPAARTPAFAEEGGPGAAFDPTFGGGDGFTTEGPAAAVDVAVEEAGSILTASTIDGDLAVTRFTESGNLDLSFGINGTSRASFTEAGVVRAVAATPDGGIVVAGTIGSGPDARPGLAKVRPDGAPDGSFGSGGLSQPATSGPTELAGIVVQPDGRILLIGTLRDAGGASKLQVTALTPNGRVATGFGDRGRFTLSSAAQARGRALTAMSDGTIVAAGELDGPQVVQPLLVRLSSSGQHIETLTQEINNEEQLDPSDPPPIPANVTITSVAVQQDQKVVLGGFIDTCRGNPGTSALVVRFSHEGVLDRYFATSGVVRLCPLNRSNWFNDMALRHDGRMVGAGAFDDFGRIVATARGVHSDGLFDDGFGGPLDDRSVDSEYAAVAIDGQKRVLVAGRHGASPFLARYPAPAPADPITFKENGRIVLERNDGTSSNIYITDPDPGTGSARRLIGDPSDSNDPSDIDPTITRDGRRLFWARRPVGGDFDLMWTDTIGREPYNTVSNESGDQIQPSLSADGLRIAYTHVVGDEQSVRAQDWNGGNQTVLATGIPDTNGASTPDYSPVADLVLYQANRDIYVVGGDGSSSTQLTDTPEWEVEPAWSPDGSKIAYARRDVGGVFNIWVMDADGSNRRQVTNYSSGPATNPSWSPFGTRLSYIRLNRLHTVGADGSDDVDLTAGEGGQWRSLMEIRSAQTSVKASPSSIPASEIPFQQQSSAIRSAAITVQDISDSPIALLDLTASPIALLDLTASPIALLDLTASPIALLDLTASPVADLVRRALEATLLSDLPLLTDGGWPALVGDRLEGAIQSHTLMDVLSLEPPVTVKVGDMNLTSSRLGAMTPIALSLGKTPLSAIAMAGGWCTRLEGLGYADCGAELGRPGDPRKGLSASLFELQLAGVPLEGVPLVDIRMRDIDLSAGPAALGGVAVASVDLATSNLGAVLVSALPDPDVVVNCAGDTTCDSGSLHDAQRTGRIRPSATLGHLGSAIGHLRLAEVVLGLFRPEANPLQEVPVSALGIENYAGPGSSLIDYTYNFAPQGVPETRRLTVRIVLPEGVVYEPGSGLFDASVQEEGGPVRIDPFVEGSELLFVPTTPTRAGDEMALTFSARPGLRLNVGAASAHFLDEGTFPQIDETIYNRATVEIGENFEPENNEIATAPEIEADTLYVTHISSAEDRDLFKLNVPAAGSRVIVTLAPDDADDDLLVYAPANSAPSIPLRAVPQAAATIIPVTSSAVPMRARSGEPLQAEALGDIDLAHLEDLPVVGVSANRSTADETVVFSAPTAGDYFIQVTGYNGGASDGPYTLMGRVEPPAAPIGCTARTFAHDSNPSQGADESMSRGTIPSSIGAGVQTLILVNRDRLHDTYGEVPTASLMSRLGTLATDGSVAGAIVSVDGSDAVRAAYDAWDANPCAPESANQVVRTINGVVDSLIDLSSGQILNIVLVGSDEILPFSRIPDLTQSANERGYADTARVKGPDNAVSASLRAGYLLADDAFGDAIPTPYFGRWLYVSDVALGRLVETPQEMEVMVDSYLSGGGLLDVSTALTTGYDFMSDLSRDNDAAFDAALGPQPELISETWTAEDVHDAFTAQPQAPGFVALNGHFDHTRLEPPVIDSSAQDDGRFATSRIDAGPPLSDSVIFSIGCHSGLSFADVVIGAPTPEQTRLVRDWAQSIAAKQGVFAGQTGFGLGLEHALALSEVIMADFGRNLAAQAGTVGSALTRAKQAYLGQLGMFGVYDEKALAQTVLYGLPMFRIGENPLPEAPAPLPTRGDPSTGLVVADVKVNPQFTLTPSAGEPAPDGRFYSVDGKTQVVPDRPIQPKTTVDVTQPGTTARGALITGLVSVEETGFDPIFAAAAVDEAAAAPESASSTALFPAAIHSIAAYQAVDGPRQNLVLVPGQFQSTGTSGREIVGTQRLFTTIEAEVFYSAGADTIPARIHRTEATRIGTTAAFRVITTDSTPSGDGEVARVRVTYRDRSGEWHGVELSRDPANPETWAGGAVLGVDGEVEYFAQVVDQAGNVSQSTNKGELFPATVAASPPAGIDVSVSGTPAPAGNGFLEDATVTITGQPTVTFEVSIDGRPFSAYAGPFAVIGDGMHTVDYVASSGERGREIVLIDALPPVGIIRAPEDGRVYEAGEPLTASYACSDAGAGVATCDGDLPSGSPIDTSTPGDYTFTLVSTDNAGRSSTSVVRYTIEGGLTAEGFFAPVSSDSMNKVKAGSTVPLKWRLRNVDGTLRTDRDSVIEIWSERVPCPGEIGVGGPGFADRRTHDLRVKLTGDTWHANWKTDRIWTTTCRQLSILFEDGASLRATFQLR